MNSNENSTHENAAAQRAEAGTTARENAVRLQLRATPDHADFYALASELVCTLRAVDDLTRVLRRQVAGYAQGQRDQGRVLYDDTRKVDPIERLHVATLQLEEFGSATVTATEWANQ